MLVINTVPNVTIIPPSDTKVPEPEFTMGFGPSYSTNEYHEPSNTPKCNLCGRVFDLWDMLEDFTIHKDKLGYGTKHDGDSVHLRLCCACFDRLTDSCFIDPITECDSGAD